MLIHLNIRINIKIYLRKWLLYERRLEDVKKDSSSNFK